MLVELIVPVSVTLLALNARRRRDAYLLLAAAAVLLVAVTPPVHTAAHRSVTGHMVQHLLLIVVAAPMIGMVAAGAPTRRRSVRWVRRAAAVAVRPGPAPLVAGAVHAVTVLAWHHPALYDAAVDHWAVHGLEHALLLSTGVWWWATVFHHTARSAVFAPVLSLFGVATSCAVLGVFLMFAPDPLFAQGDVGDQQLAGALMAGAAGAVYGGMAFGSIAGAVRRLGTPGRPRIPAGSRSVIVISAAAAGLIALAGYGTQAETSGPAPESSHVPAADVPDVKARGAAVPTADVPDVDDGRELYRRDCAACHGVDGAGSFRGVPIDEVGTASVRYSLSTGRMPIARPDAAVVRGAPAYGDAEIDAIVAYTATFVDGPELPDLAAASPDLGQGGVLYRLHCAACHGSTGIGGAQAIEGTAPSVLHATADEVAAAMVAGPGGMPAFRSTFDDDDIAGVAAYVGVLQDPPTTGIPIPGGRVGEGLVAWVLGVGVLLGAVSWIGRRA